MRTLKELLQITLDNLDEYWGLNSFYGLCFVNGELFVNSIIDDEECDLLNEYFISHARKSKYYKETGRGFIFEPKDKESRRAWLIEHIKLNSSM